MHVEQCTANTSKDSACLHATHPESSTSISHRSVHHFLGSSRDVRDVSGTLKHSIIQFKDPCWPSTSPCFEHDQQSGLETAEQRTYQQMRASVPNLDSTAAIPSSGMPIDGRVSFLALTEPGPTNVPLLQRCGCENEVKPSDPTVLDDLPLEQLLLRLSQSELNTLIKVATQKTKDSPVGIKPRNTAEPDPVACVVPNKNAAEPGSATYITSDPGQGSDVMSRREVTDSEAFPNPTSGRSFTSNCKGTTNSKRKSRAAQTTITGEKCKHGSHTMTVY